MFQQQHTFLYIAILSLCLGANACKPSFYQASKTSNLSQEIDAKIVTASSPMANEVANTIAPYKAELTELMEVSIGHTEVAMKKGKPESLLGNWVSDLLQQAAQDLFTEKVIDFSAQNYGGIRINEIAAGAITVGDIYSLMPFDNELVAVEMNGFVLNQFINHMAAEGGWPVSKELHFRISNDKATDISIQGAPIAFNRNYIVALPDYVANGGSDCGMLSDRQSYKSGKKIRDLLIEYTKKTEGAIEAKLDNRITR